jgi:hypothetical protein
MDFFKQRKSKKNHDVEFTTDCEKQDFTLNLFWRVAAKNKTFTKVDFKYCVFEDCYFRNCKFVDCDFTGCQFRNSVLRGSEFEACQFDYCRFDKCVIPYEILNTSLPRRHNLALEFARSLRINYSQIGDTVGVNRAISAELEATRMDHRKAAWSDELYYRQKFTGLLHAKQIVTDLWFRFLNFVWGNGESIWKVFRSIVIVNVLVAVIVWFNQKGTVGSALLDALGLFWGTYKLQDFPLLFAIATALRFTLIGLFITVLVRRLSRR